MEVASHAQICAGNPGMSLVFATILLNGFKAQRTSSELQERKLLGLWPNIFNCWSMFWSRSLSQKITQPFGLAAGDHAAGVMVSRDWAAFGFFTRVHEQLRTLLENVADLARQRPFSLVVWFHSKRCTCEVFFSGRV